MQIVIEISDRLIKKVKDYYVNPYEVDEICEAILDGTPLPEHHGRLIDADALIQELSVVSSRPVKSQLYILREAPTIIEVEEVQDD